MKNTDQDLRNAERLANALESEADGAVLRQIARMLNYNVEQLEEDIKSLYTVVKNAE